MGLGVGLYVIYATLIDSKQWGNSPTSPPPGGALQKVDFYHRKKFSKAVGPPPGVGTRRKIVDGSGCGFFSWGKYWNISQ